jgi:hypothetical protein
MNTKSWEPGIGKLIESIHEHKIHSEHGAHPFKALLNTTNCKQSAQVQNSAIKQLGQLKHNLHIIVTPKGMHAFAHLTLMHENQQN